MNKIHKLKKICICGMLDTGDANKNPSIMDEIKCHRGGAGADRGWAGS